MSFSSKVRQELVPLQNKYFTLIKEKLIVNRLDKNADCDPDHGGDPMDPQEEDIRASIRGAFLLGGSISDPSKSYHLEIVARSKDEAYELAQNMKLYNISARVHERKGSFVVYTKDGSDIATMLGLMGAHNSLMDFENIRILNGMRGSINRQVNCETANIKRTVDTAVRQIAAIHRIEQEQGLDSLPVALKEMAEIRLEYPQASLSQLGEYLHPPVGKSGVNHRMRKLMEISKAIS